MKISNVINELEKTKQEEGDIEVYVENDDGSCLEEPSFFVMTGDEKRKLIVPSKTCRCGSCMEEVSITSPWLEIF